MVATPNWLAATTGSAAQAGHVNQFLGTHGSTELYAGTIQSNQTVAGTGGTSTNGTWLAQSFSTGASQTTVGYVLVNVTTNTALGSNLSPLSFQVFANTAGAPSGAALSTTTVTTEYVNGVAAPMLVPINLTGLAASTQFWLVIPAVGNASFSYTWNKSNQASGASTSTNGTAWTAQTYGFLYQVFDKTASGSLQSTWEDGGVRWTSYSYAAGNNLLTKVNEYTAGQTASGYLQSTRTLTYVNALLTGVA